MSADSLQFVDTNVLVYAHDRTAGSKHDSARQLVHELWRSRRGVVSTQVLQEFYVTVRKKVAVPLSREEARELIVDFRSWRVVVNDEHSILDAIELEERFRISFWDALIVQAAITSGADVLYSEDLNAGQTYGTVTVVNPFTV